MRDNTIEYKVKIFISSDCEDRYKIARKALKTLLEETGLAIVYLFETSGASSLNVELSYMSHLDDSDICVFIFDNADSVPQGVIKEQKRAREKKIKSLYFFCDETKKGKTQFEKEIISSELEKVHTVHEFADFAPVAYKHVIEDIVNIYRFYNKGFLKSDEFDTSKPDTPYQSHDLYTVDKSIINGFSLTKDSLSNIFYRSIHKEINPTQLDEMCKKLLYIIIGKESGEGYSYSLLLAELEKIHSKDIIDFIKLRWEAIQLYFDGDLNKCLICLKSAYQVGQTKNCVPNWLINDVLIDIRNIESLVYETQNKIIIKTETQEKIDINPEKVYYPLLDRFYSSYKAEVLMDLLRHRIKTPYTTLFGALDSLFDNISSAFIIAVIYGSLTHVLGVKNNLVEALSNLCFVYRDHTIYLELLRSLILSQDDKKINQIARAYNQTTEMINEADAKNLYQTALSIPIEHKRFASKLIAFKNLGYYLSDEFYNEVSSGLLDEINRWLDNENRVFFVEQYVLKALLHNIRRLDHDSVINIILRIFHINYQRCYDDVFKIIKAMELSKLKEENLSTIIDYLLKFVSDEKLRTNFPSLAYILIYIRKTSSIKSREIDNTIKQHMESFYLNEYSLEISSAKSDIKTYLARYIQIIHEQNEAQGKEGKYHGWGINPFDTIMNIIEYDNLLLCWDDVEPIVEAIEETVFSERQTIAAKVDAISLLIFLNHNSKCRKELMKTFYKWVENENIILNANEDGIFDKSTLETLRFSLLLLRICFGEEEVDELLSSFMILKEQSDYGIIKSLLSLSTLLYNIDYKNLHPTIATAITQYVVNMSFSEDKDVRLKALRVLFLLCRSPHQTIAINQISKMMDNDNEATKAYILNKINILEECDKEIADLIKKKGEVDNHYLVRNLIAKTGKN